MHIWLTQYADGGRIAFGSVWIKGEEILVYVNVLVNDGPIVASMRSGRRPKDPAPQFLLVHIVENLGTTEGQGRRRRKFRLAK
jgi:hypothetical protein